MPSHPHSKTFKRTLARTIILPLALLFALTTVLLLQIQFLRSESTRVEHSDEVIAHAHEMLKLLVDMESGIRGYLVTGNPVFLEPCEKAEPNIEPSFQRLENLVKDRPSQLEHLKRVREHHVRWKGFAQTIKRMKDEGGDYAAYANQGTSKDLMDKMRVEVASLIQTEEQERDARHASVRYAALVVIVTAISLALILGTVIVILNRRQFLFLSRSYDQALEAEHERAKELVLSEERTTAIVASVPGMVWECLIDPETMERKFSFVSAYAEQMFGYPVDEWYQSRNFALKHIPAEDNVRVANEIRNIIENHRTGIIRYRSAAKDGRILWAESKMVARYDENGRPVALYGVTFDITEHVNAEEALQESEDRFRQSQKMEAVGQLAGGVAHDFNNLLTAIVGYSDLSLRRLTEHDQLYHNLDAIRKAGQHAASLTRQLLAFSRKQVLQPQILNLNSVVSETEMMLRRLLPENIGLKTNLGPTTDLVSADPSQLEQVILNLVVNARDAMPGGGNIIIETSNVELDETYSPTHFEVKPGRYVMLAASDTGVGMDRETQQRIFEPFFTTKEKGKGTGLGLSTVYGIVKQSNGHIQVSSEPGVGTTFKIYLPQVEGEVSGVEQKVRGESLRGSETILLVEDEEIVRKLTRDILQMSGYQVLEVANGDEALRICEEFEGPIQLMLTDVIMPGMSGRVLAERLKGTRPSLRVLFMSGYTDDAIAHHGVLEPGLLLLEKPFMPDALISKVREALDMKGM